MFVGCLAYREQNIRTILAYTTVSQMGYVMAGLICNNVDAWRYAFFYLLMYSIQIAVFFSILLLLQNKINITHLNQLYLVKFYNIRFYYVLLLVFFSFAGIPPFSGFFLKYFLFLQLYQNGWYILTICGLISGFLMAIIYLQMILQLT